MDHCTGPFTSKLQREAAAQFVATDPQDIVALIPAALAYPPRARPTHRLDFERHELVKLSQRLLGIMRDNPRQRGVLGAADEPLSDYMARLDGVPHDYREVAVKIALAKLRIRDAEEREENARQAEAAALGLPG